MDAYQMLRPWTNIEACECSSVDGLLLVDLLTNNPLHCSACKREVDAARLNLSSTEVDAVYRWYSARRALNSLWLDSGEYEAYAKARLLDPKGQVNQLGIELAHRLSARMPTRLWLFHDADDGEPTNCPMCGSKLDTDVKWGVGRCLVCPILI
jgi:hypothetical protein